MAKCDKCNYPYAEAGKKCPSCGAHVNDPVANMLVIIAIIVVIAIIIGLILGPAYLVFKALKNKDVKKINWWLIGGISSSIVAIILSTYIGESNDDIWIWVGKLTFYANIVVLVVSLFFAVTNYKVQILSIFDSSRKRLAQKVKTNADEPVKKDNIVTEENTSDKNASGIFKTKKILIFLSLLILLVFGGYFIWDMVSAPKKDYNSNITQVSNEFESSNQVNEELSTIEKVPYEEEDYEDEISDEQIEQELAAQRILSILQDSIVGTYIGDFGKNELTIFIETVNLETQQVFGWNQVKDTKRKLTGKYDIIEDDGTFIFTLSEPGDAEWDGVFDFSINVENLSKLDGIWTANNGKLERKYTLKKLN